MYPCADRGLRIVGLLLVASLASSPALAQLAPLITESDSATRILKYSVYAPTTWPAPASNGVTAGFQGSFPVGPVHWQVASTRPDRMRQMAVFVEDVPASRDYLYAAFWDGTNWDDGSGGATGDAHNFQRIGQSGSVDFRGFDAAYEQQSGEALVVAGINIDESVNIWVYNGAAWSGNLRASPLGNGTMPNQAQDTSNLFDWVRLAPRPGTNQIGFIGIGNDYGAFDSAAIHVAIWDGDTNTFGSKLIVSYPNTGPDGITPQNYHGTDAVDIDFVLNGTRAGEVVAVWGTDTKVWANTWNSSIGWVGNVQVADLGVGNTVRWIRQAASPRNDDTVIAIEDVNEQIYTVRYDGDTRTFGSFTATPLTSTAFGNADFNRPFDVIWDPAAGPNSVMLVYSNTANTRYRTSANGGVSWGSEQILGSTGYWVQLERETDNTIHTAIHDNADRLAAALWNGSSWTFTTPAAISTNLEQDANHNVEAFALAVSALSPSAAWGPLSVTDGGSTLTVTSSAFEMVFEAQSGGSITEYYDLALDPSRTYDLAAGAVDVKGLLHMGWRPQGGSGWFKTTEDTRGRMDLLEFTDVRVKVRSRAFFESSTLGILPGLVMTSDHSIHASGRLASDWSLHATEAMTAEDIPFGLGIHYDSNTSNPLNKWTAYSETGAMGINPATDDFILVEIDEPAIQNDFLHIAYEDWSSPPYSFDADETSSVSFADWLFPVWRDTTVGSVMPADSTERWQSLTYLKPTYFVDHNDSAVTARSADYRSPSGLTISTGAGWNENPADADFFNESEAVYTVDADPANGLVFDLDGSTTTRYNPLVKVRQWRSLSGPTQVSLEGNVLASGSGYMAAVKPFSTFYGAQDYVWYSTLEDNSATTAPDVGSAGSVNGGATFTTARYGDGLLVDAAGEYVSFGSAAMDVTSGAIEFWMRPSFNHNDGVPHAFWHAEGPGGRRLMLEKDSSDNLEFGIQNGASTMVRIAPADYFWGAGEWVHIRAEWWEAGAVGFQLRLYVNGLEPAHTDSGTYNSVGMSVTSNFVGNISNGLRPANAIIDEFRMYDAAFSPNVYAAGGLTSSPNERIASTTSNYTFDIWAADAEGRTDYFYFGSDARFRGLNIALATAGVGTPDLIWEYWDGDSWGDLEAVPGFTDELNNLTADDGTIYWTSDPAGWTPYSIRGGPDLYYVRLHAALGSVYTTFPQEGLIKTDILLFQYCSEITASAQTFDFTLPMPTEVDLVSFAGESTGFGVRLDWETASELNNIGFHVYRSRNETSGYQRLSASLIPGLGSSPVGARYSYEDRTVSPSETYFYRLEDIDRRGKRSEHGPISVSVLENLDPGREDEGLSDEEQPVSRVAYGRPEANEYRVLRQTRTRAVVELSTEGFYVDVLEDGRARVWVPGLEDFVEERLALPVKRVTVDAVVGFNTELGPVKARGLRRFGALPSASELELSLSADNEGVVRARRRLRRRAKLDAAAIPSEWARLEGNVFQGDRKKASVSLFPLRYDGAREDLVLARRLRVTLFFRGKAEGEEVTRDGRARRRRNTIPKEGVLARLVTREAGLYGVSYEGVFGTRHRRRRNALNVTLSRRGEAVPYHLEPSGQGFGPGSTLYFLSEGALLNEYDDEAVFELRMGEGKRMPLVSAPPRGARLTSFSQTERYEENRFYQAGLVDEEELWLWDILVSPVTKEYAFSVTGLVGASEAALSLRLQGISDLGVEGEHHIRVRVNGVLADESSWSGPRSQLIETSIPPGVLREGDNVLSLENLGASGAAYSMVMLDRFDLSSERVLSTVGFAGVFHDSGTISLDVTNGLPLAVKESESGPSWLEGVWSSGSYHLGVEAGASYRVVDQVLQPEIRRSVKTGLDKHAPVQWLAITPQAFVEELEPLAQRRREQGLTTKIVTAESVYEGFGYGERSPEALKRFIGHAYHEWGGLEYVVLVGDMSYDPKDFLGTGKPSHLPSKTVRTSYLWTASDVALGAVNGEDTIPDVAMGRLPAANVAELEAMVSKILAYESQPGLSNAATVFVTDNADIAGDFKVNARAIAAEFFSDGNTRQIHLEELGVAHTKNEIFDMWNDGAELVSYIGHGGIHLWANENLFHIDDVDGLSSPSRLPLLLTMNCLNGYFHFPYFDALSEKLVKADGKGAIAAFSPTGLSLNEPAHEYHRFLIDALTSNRHQRLGDAVLEAQERYVGSGAFPELLSIYHLIGDPALKVSH